MRDLLVHVREFVLRRDLLAPGSTVVVAVSGGADSLCLLHLLHQIAPELGLRLHVAHLDHGLRGGEARADAEFVAETAREWGLPFALGSADVAALQAESGLSLEEAARVARYGFLAKVSAEVGAGAIALGHTADDQAETVLMHFLRGSGLAGLRGMLPVSPLSELHLQAPPPTNLKLVRPLLEVSRAGTEAYCREHGLSARLDISNSDLTIFRNRLRHDLLPLLEQYNPRIRAVLAHTADVAAGDYEVLASQTEAVWRSLVRSGPAGEVTLDLHGWRALPVGLQRATVRRATKQLRHDLRNVNWEHTERAIWLARAGHAGQKATLVGGLELQLGYDLLRMAPEGTPWPASGLLQLVRDERISAPGATVVDGWVLIAELLPANEAAARGGAPDSGWTAHLDAALAGPDLWLRRRLEGEKFQPQGLGGRHASLAEFMTNVRIPRELRDGWPVLANDSQVLWVAGYRVDERVRLTASTRQVWRITLKREGREWRG